MKNLLINFGCSFTYGEGLEFHFWQEKYPYLFDIYKNKLSYQPCNTVFTSFEDFILFREENRYNGILKKLLNFSLVGKSNNGGSNYQNIDTMEVIISTLETEKNLIPKYCVFQFTNIIRDVETFCRENNNMNSSDVENWLGKSLKKNLIENANLINNPLYRKNINGLIKEVFIIILDKLTEQFDKLEKMGCKCVFFMGLDDEYSHHLVEEKIKLNKYFLPIIFNGREYRSWDNMNRKCYLTLRHNIGVTDDHPCLDSHQWIANQLYKKYLEIN